LKDAGFKKVVTSIADGRYTIFFSRALMGKVCTQFSPKKHLLFVIFNDFMCLAPLFSKLSALLLRGFFSKSRAAFSVDSTLQLFASRLLPQVTLFLLIRAWSKFATSFPGNRNHPSEGLPPRVLQPPPAPALPAPNLDRIPYRQSV